MIIVLTIAGFLFLGLASILWKAHKANKDDFTDFDWPSDVLKKEPAPVPVRSRSARSNIVSINKRDK